MGNSQNNTNYLNILVFDPSKTQYIESLFRPLVFYYCSIQTIQSKYLKFPSSSIAYAPTSIPFINDLQWRFYFINNEGENDLENLFENDLHNSVNNVAIIIGNKEETRKLISLIYKKIQKTLFILLTKQNNGSYRNSDLFEYIQQNFSKQNKNLIKIHLQREPEKIKLDLLKIYSYYNELGDIFSFRQDDSNNFLINNHIKSLNSVNYFYSQNTKEIVPEENCFGVMVVGPRKVGKSHLINISLHEERAKVGLGGTSKITGYIHSKYPICFYDTPGININDKKDFDSLYEIIERYPNIKCILYFLNKLPDINEKQFFESMFSKKKIPIYLITQDQSNFLLEYYCHLDANQFQYSIFNIDLLKCEGIRNLYFKLGYSFIKNSINFSDDFISEDNEYLKQYFKDGDIKFFSQIVIESLKLFHFYLCSAINYIEELDIYQKNIREILTANSNLLSYITEMLHSIAVTAGEKHNSKQKIKEKIKCLYTEVTESLFDYKIINKCEINIYKLCTQNYISSEYAFNKIIEDVCDYLNIPSIRIIYNFGLIALLNYYNGLLHAINCFRPSIINMHLAVRGLFKIGSEYN